MKRFGLLTILPKEKWTTILGPNKGDQMQTIFEHFKGENA